MYHTAKSGKTRSGNVDGVSPLVWVVLGILPIVFRHLPTVVIVATSGAKVDATAATSITFTVVSLFVALAILGLRLNEACHGDGGSSGGGGGGGGGRRGIGSSLQSFDDQGNADDDDVTDDDDSDEYGEDDGDGVDEYGDGENGAYGFDNATGASAFDESAFSGFGDDALNYDALSSSSSDDDFELAAPPLPEKSKASSVRESATRGAAKSTALNGAGRPKSNAGGSSKIAGRAKLATKGRSNAPAGKNPETPPSLPAKQTASKKTADSESFEGFGEVADMYIDVVEVPAVESSSAVKSSRSSTTSRTKANGVKPSKCKRGDVSGGRTCYKPALEGQPYCGGHLCNHSGCSKSKSSADEFCADHRTAASMAGEYVDVVGDQERPSSSASANVPAIDDTEGFGWGDGSGDDDAGNVSPDDDDDDSDDDDDDSSDDAPSAAEGPIGITL